MNINEIAEAIIYKQHGWAVAEQFEVTWDNQSIDSFTDQNSNALEYIRETILELTHSDALTEYAIEDLHYYLKSMKEAMDSIEDEGPEHDSAGFTEDDRIVEGQYKVISNEEADEDYKTSLNK